MGRTATMRLVKACEVAKGQRGRRSCKGRGNLNAWPKGQRDAPSAKTRPFHWLPCAFASSWRDEAA